MKRMLCLLLTFLLLLTAVCLPMTACAEGEEGPGTTHDTSAPEEQTEGRDEYGRLLVPSSLPDDLQFSNETVTIFFRDRCSIMDTTLEFKSEGLNSEPVNDAVFTRNKEVENRLGVVLEYELIDGVTFDPYLSAVRKSWQAGDGSYDILAYYAYYGVAMATEGMMSNLLDETYMDLSKPWWNQDFVNEMTLCDQLYFAVGDLSLTATQCTNAVFFNKKMMSEMFGGTDLYATVQNGDWTMDTFGTMIAQCYSDINGDGKRDRGDRYGAELTAVSIPMDAYIMALGCSITEKDEDGIPQIAFGSDHCVDAFDKLFELIIHNEGSLTGPCLYEHYDEAQEKFTSSETLFLLDVFQATDKLRTMSVDYGVLPLFKYDKAQAGYYTSVSDLFSLLSIFAATRHGAAADAVMELMAQKSYEKVTPAYFEISLKQKYSQSNQDAQMFDLTLAGRRFNFGFVYSNELGNPTHLWRQIIEAQSNTFASRLKSVNRTYSNSLKKLVGKYEKMGG